MRGAAGTLKRALRKVFREALLIGFQEVVEAAAASERKGSAYISIPCEAAAAMTDEFHLRFFAVWERICR